jgi:hypothetical protein
MNALGDSPMNMMERLALVEYQRNGKARAASGLRVGGPYVLTAGHCAKGDNLEIIVGGRTYGASVFVRSDEPDLAVLEIDDRAPTLESLSCVRVDRNTATDIACVALGYPNWKTVRSASISAQVSGYIPTTEGITAKSPEGGQLSLKIRDKPAVGDWGGMSGAVVLTQLTGQVLGVVKSYRATEGMGSLILEPIDAISRLPRALAAAFESALSVSDFSALAIAPQTSPTDVDPRVLKQLISMLGERMELLVDGQFESLIDSGTLADASSARNNALDYVENHPGQAASIVSSALRGGGRTLGHVEELAVRISAMLATVSQLGPGVMALKGSFCSPLDVTVIDTRREDPTPLAMPHLPPESDRIEFPATVVAVEEGIPRMWIIRPPEGVDREECIRKFNDYFRVDPDARSQSKVAHPKRLAASVLAGIIGIDEVHDSSRHIGRVASIFDTFVELDLISEPERSRVAPPRHDWPFDFGIAHSTTTPDLSDLGQFLRATTMEQEFERAGFSRENLRLIPRGIAELSASLQNRRAEARRAEAARADYKRSIRDALGTFEEL